ncbi:UNVERIFIED_CONTAM: hypothetical protein K2H54_064087 [Gekko kuhli]
MRVYWESVSCRTHRALSPFRQRSLYGIKWNRQKKNQRKEIPSYCPPSGCENARAFKVAPVWRRKPRTELSKQGTLNNVSFERKTTWMDIADARDSQSPDPVRGWGKRSIVILQRKSYVQNVGPRPVPPQDSPKGEGRAATVAPERKIEFYTIFFLKPFQ